MGTKEFFTKGLPNRVGYVLGTMLPPALGRAGAALAAKAIVTFQPDMYRATYDNLRHVLGAGADEAAIKQAVYHVYRQAVLAYYEFFHNVGRGRVRMDAFEPPVRLTEDTKSRLETAMSSGRGLFIVGCHMSNFDLGGVALGQYLPVPLQALSYANPSEGFQIFNELRQKCGLEMTPISLKSLRQAIRRLQQGGIVITGVDRPIDQGNRPVEFFGATACLPTGYIDLPLRTNSLVLPLTAHFEDGVYWVVSRPLLEMEHTGNRRRDREVNVRRVLAEIEALIRQHPDQWMMFVPVWPQECHA